MNKIGIIIVVESGDLEQKTRLLVESIRTFGGDIKDAKIWAVKPRKGKSLKKETLSFFKEREVEFLDVNLNKKWYLYGFANKIYATAYIEEHYGSEYEILLFLDCDTVVVDNIDLGFFKEEFGIAVKPVDSVFISVPFGQELSDYWQIIYDSCRITSYPSWFVKTTVENLEILPYFNSGVIFSHPCHKIYQKWLMNFERITKDVRAYHLTYMEFYLIEQALFSGTLINSLHQSQILFLPNSHNFPLTHYDKLQEKNMLEHNVKILHYHKLFTNTKTFECEGVSDDKKKWIQDFLPFLKFRDAFFKKNYKKLNYIQWRLRKKGKLKIKKLYEKRVIVE